MPTNQKKHLNGILLFALLILATCIILLPALFTKRDKTRSPSSPASLSKENTNYRDTVFSDTFSLMTYNVENLFDAVDIGTEYDQFNTKKSNWNREMYEIKLENIASVIASSRPDISALCEVENESVAKDLQVRLTNKGFSFPYIAVGTLPPASVTSQMLLSRFPIDSVNILNGTSINSLYSRGILEAKLRIGASYLRVFVIHFPSKHQKESSRINAVGPLIKRLRELPDSTDYIIAGDFNSNYNEAESFDIEGLNDTHGETSINHLLKTSISPPNERLRFVQKSFLRNHSNQGFHFDPWLDLPIEKRWNYLYRGMKNTLDHILLPAALFDKKGISYLDHSFGVFLWDGRLMYKGKPFGWQMYYIKQGAIHRGAGYSDHLPVYARFTIRPFVFADTMEIDTTNNPVSRNSIQPQPLAEFDFEQGTQGWVSVNASVTLHIDKKDKAKGNYSLCIQGTAKENQTAAKASIPIDKKLLSSDSRGIVISFMCKGSGWFGFRTSGNGKKWTYYTGDLFDRPSGRSVYLPHALKEWTEIHLPVIPDSLISGNIHFEVRTGGAKPLCLWLDEIKVIQAPPDTNLLQ